MFILFWDKMNQEKLSTFLNRTKQCRLTHRSWRGKLQMVQKTVKRTII